MRVHVCACVWSGKYRHVSCNDNRVPADAIRCLASRPTLCDALRAGRRYDALRAGRRYDTLRAGRRYTTPFEQADATVPYEQDDDTCYGAIRAGP